MDRAEDAVEKKADDMVKTLQDHGGKIDKSKDSHKENEDRRKRDFENCDKHGDDDEVPMYILNLDGTVDKLLPNGSIDPKGLDSNDKLNLAGVIENGKVWRPQSDSDRTEWNTPTGHTGTVNSTKINPATDDLARATQLAREAHNYYQGKNYAAGRYIDPASGRESILIGRSDGSYHSEKIIGHPLLKAGKQSGLTELFTEREPCQLSPRCNRWLDAYFSSTKVTHAADYDQSQPKTRNDEHKEYLRKIKP